MNIKSLLLGSAAALIAVSGARAVDAVTVAEPEPAEYVKICDVYGSGYFYIPGTETCLRIGGYIRYDIGFGDIAGHQDVPDRMGDGTHDTYHKLARFTLKTWTGQETELGTLRTYTENRFNFGDGWDEEDSGSQWSLNFAWIQLGGFRVGKDETAWDTFSGYAGSVIEDSLVGYGGDFDTNLIQYTFDAGNGFSAVVSLEDGDGANTIDSYIPHMVGGVKYTQGWGGVSGTVAYDSNYEEWAGKVRLDVNATDAISLWAMATYGTEKNVVHNFFKNWEGNWAVYGGGTYKFNEKTSFNAQLSYDEGKTFGLAANVAYDIVPGFTITGEVDYVNQGSSDYHPVSDDFWGAHLRFQRSF
ncbi:MAG: porin [Mesorhizobium sp.]|uniref:porin n=2 Tax=Mesorhizobium sp. TaxID=1871066 RepID=UPI000FE8DF08|nr:porin [Mesorhizobium sp.]RWA73409.1 MAG: porin [Mesorhizobium sp.]RWC01923.1 MAG: porin [Mesorhizobium sp.]RWK29742.1 MAG: porin [Mesorhizobium sp.]TIQ43638.1 MAG: porin [Mesorhizobium sp.]